MPFLDGSALGTFWSKAKGFFKDNYAVKRYGFRINQANSDPYNSVTYLYDAVGKTPAKLNSSNVWTWGSWQEFVEYICRPVMLGADGTVLYELAHNDHSKMIDGTSASAVADSTQAANAMVQFRKLYISITAPSSNTIDVVFCPVKLDETYQAFAFTDQYGNEKEYFYHSMFNGSKDTNNKLRSIATGAAPLASTAGTTLRTYAQANGNGWDFPSWSQRTYINMLHILISKNLNSQGVFGQGNGNGGQNGPTMCGSLSTAGAFAGDLTDETKAVKSFYIENYWGEVWNWHNGVINIGDGTNANLYVRNTPPYTNSSIEGYKKKSSVGPNSNNYVIKMGVTDGVLLPVSVGGDSASYWCDYFYQAHASGTTYSALVGGGRNGRRAGCGCWYLSVHCALSYSDWHFGARLAFL